MTTNDALAVRELAVNEVDQVSGAVIPAAFWGGIAMGVLGNVVYDELKSAGVFAPIKLPFQR